MILPKDFYLRDTLLVAKDLLGKMIIRTINGQKLSGIIVETEAYLNNDEACHASRGMTPRNQPMFEEGGISYVYFIYGMYHCFNIVTEEKNKGCAVLIRAIEPVAGIATMQLNRGNSKPSNLTNGPGKLAQALSITKKDNSIQLYSKNEIVITQTNIVIPEITTTTRIGINKASERPYRFYIKSNPYVSVY